MGQRVAAETVIDAAPDQIYAVIADLEAYPDWAEDVVRTEVVERGDDGLPHLVAFEVDARIAMVHYVLRYQHDPPHRVRWPVHARAFESAACHVATSGYAGADHWPGR